MPLIMLFLWIIVYAIMAIADGNDWRPLTGIIGFILAMVVVCGLAKICGC